MVEQSPDKLKHASSSPTTLVYLHSGLVNELADDTACTEWSHAAQHIHSINVGGAGYIATTSYNSFFSSSLSTFLLPKKLRKTLYPIWMELMYNSLCDGGMNAKLMV
mmetsp:Transcript_21769/g.46579  ORF Transcript_21769/g.46579 Transcript_21769/m.46579 type:complete len:107 (+) Transcript_21769:116-436(+)